jgi:hypothetical protein
MTTILRENCSAIPTEIPLLYFFHLPRTGGTTINRMLKYAFGHRAIFHADLLAEYAGEDALAAALAQGQRMDRGALLITGHYGAEHPLVVHAKRPVRIAAVMRHPLERIISLYDYIRGRPDHPEHAALIGCTLHQALDTVPEFAAHCRNAQLRTLFNVTDQAGIMAALRRHPYLLGRMEALEAFAQILLGLFGLRLGGQLPRCNERPVLTGVAPARSQPDYTAALARLAVDNSAELAFYTHMPPIFSNFAKASGPIAAVDSRQQCESAH